MNNLLLIEKALLESLSSGARSVTELTAELGVSDLIIKNTISSLIELDLIIFNGEKYELSSTKLASMQIKAKDDQIMSDEIYHAIDDLRVFKLSLDSFEEKLLQIHLKNFNDFVTGIRNKTRLNQGAGPKVRLVDQRVFAIGVSRYGDLLKSSLMI